MIDVDFLKATHDRLMAENKQWWGTIDAELTRRQNDVDQTLRKSALFLFIATLEAIGVAAYVTYRVFS